LRKYGVRFGAYHIYLPVLLKPAPRALATQLWALAHAGPQATGLDDLLHLAGSGRTSMPVNRDIDAALYRTAGYRVCGERAVRVDILERLADLIRPALAWRDGAAGSKPPGAVTGGGFTVVNGMTSLIGASGEEFASILRSLGYRMERRPKPQEPPAETPPATEPQPIATEQPTADAALEVEAASGERATVTGGGSVEDSLQPAADPVTMESETKAEAAAAPQAEAATESAAETAPDQRAAEPILIEVWRPGRAEGRRRAHRPRRAAGSDANSHANLRPPEQFETAGVVAAPAGEGAPQASAAPAAEPEKRDRSEQPSRHRHRRRQAGEHRSDRPQRERERPPVKRFERREREKVADPNSPFAKLAALKAQLEADAKERR
jgi:ATP-dependent RNA helicase SUPV3L1/SUV3